MKIYNENVFSSLLKILGGGKFRKAIRDAEKVVENEPGLKAELEQLAKTAAEAKSKMEKFCKNYPDSPLCKKGYGQTYEAEY